ncbi:hypothetical protein CTEN210_18610 [Chaetoceros tenuissimus]|uniref:PI3K/PI4K catalytic domain-containing protein n=1 Tax=Chaetoceros tenuissimus TaxID=426638 RepID=A0AAD3HG97_9STRA|nr:hypothetical protein CTEN210_18610 [Chaetoceros tenuissimus]
MVHATQFLLRWLYLNNLIHERAEIQSLPYIHPNWHQNQSSHDVPYQQQQKQYISSHSRDDHHSTTIQNHPMEHSMHSQERQRQSTVASSSNMTEQQRSEVEWRRKALQTIALYPPGSLRLLALDTLRLEIVHEFARELNASDEILSRYFSHKSMDNESLGNSNNNDDVDDEEGVDFNLAQEFQDAASISIQDSVLDQQHDISNEESNDNTDDPILSSQVQRALTLHQETREYLPQLVSAILHSPAPLTQSTMYTPHLNPLATLRKLLLLLCIKNPNLGIELCWLLEAEVGRAWKSLFEHRQQTGRRLIVLLPADRAAAIQQIGLEKRAAFDLLQDVESATAYGVYEDDDSHYHHSQHGEFVHSKSSVTSRDLSDFYRTSRLPASLSLKRCSHFGDTMHFIDLLTRISLDLRMCPPHLRGNYLMERLEDVNRRLRRRMVTNGSVSLDEDDNRSSHDWPTLSDVSMENIQHSIHFPLEPIATTWPCGTSDFEEIIASNLQSSSPLLQLKTEQGVMRVLNIISSKSRVLASRERCPYLVHCEVLETGMEGKDARLYSQHSQVGVTIQEALGTTYENKNKESMAYTYKIPSELSPFGVRRKRNNDAWNLNTKSSCISRVGDQSDYNIQSSHSTYPGYGIQNMQNGRIFADARSPYHQERSTANQDFSTPALTTHSNLLDRVYGKPWTEICKEVRNSSVFGHLRGWKLASFIMKAGEDIRREALVMQIISKIHDWFETEIPCENRPYLKPYTIMCVGGDAGLLECIRDAKSVDEVKKSTDGFTTLREYFVRAYGPPTSNFGRNLQYPIPLNEHGISFEKAQDNFLKSLVGYSLVCYILQIKDRHNANILLDRDGHIMHIDFGFVLGDTPKMAKVPLFNERAPFKLTNEFWEVIGGWNFNEGGLGVRFCNMFEEAFACVSTHSDELAAMIEAAILNLTRDPVESKIITIGVRNRLRMRGSHGSVQQKTFVMNLVNAALTSWGTSTYDWLQKSMNGYI